MKNVLKTKAIKLRKDGASYGEIKKKLGISKSTLSYWLKDVLLTEDQRKRFYTARVLSLSRGTQSQKERRLREIAEIVKNAKKEVSKDISL